MNYHVDLIFFLVNFFLMHTHKDKLRVVDIRFRAFYSVLCEFRDIQFRVSFIGEANHKR